MGCCLSKNGQSPSSSSPSGPLPKTTTQISKQPPIVLQTPETFTALLDNKVKSTIETDEPSKRGEKSVKEEEKGVKKREIFVIQHRKSNDRRPEPKVPSDSDVSDPCTDTTNNSSDNPHSPLECSNNPKKSAINGGAGSNILAAAANGQPVRTSSCTKEEVDAILIQCGRLSRSSSGKGNSVGAGASSENRSLRKYSGSKRSHDFDKEIGDLSIDLNCEADDERQRRRQSRGSHGRRTPSRSRERDQQQHRSGSRERGGSGGGGRRVSRSPGRRSDSPIAATHGNGNGNGSSSSSNSNNNKPGKMVSVPATVSNLSMDKSNNAGGGSNGGGDGVKRVLVKRNVGDGGSGMVGSRNAASPRRSRSPSARTNVGKYGDESNINQQQPPSLSRNSSRKAEHSPYRRTPLNEIDTNSLPFQPLASKPGLTNRTQSMKNKEIEEEVLKLPLNTLPQSANNGRAAVQGTHRRTRSRGAEGTEINYCRVNEHPSNQNTENKGEQQLKSSNHDVQVTHVVVSGADSLKLPQTIVRSRSLRRSRDLDINVDALLNPTPTPTSNYNSLLLQDIQKFHHNKNSASANANANTPTSNGTTNPNDSPFTLPASVTKANSILEAVADLNSSTNSGFSSGFADENRLRSPITDLCSRKDGNYTFVGSNNNPGGKMKFEGKDHPLIEESQVNVGGDDLMEPSFHKYVTIRKRDTNTGLGGGDIEQEESSGSNSFVGSGQHWFSSSSREPNSADSTDCWTSRSSSNTRCDDKLSPVGFTRLAISENVCRTDEESQMRLGKSRREVYDYQQNGNARGKGGSGRGGVVHSGAGSTSSMADAASL